MQYTDASPTADGGPRRVVGAMALVVGAIFGIVGLSGAEGLAYTGPVATPGSAASNKASYWGAGCTKLDIGSGKSWTADKSYDLVVLKAGTTDYAFSDVVAGDVLTIPKAISHFIFCPTTTTTTTTTATTTTTTTVPKTTTTTTTVPEETTTTTTSVAQQGPTTTTTVPEETTTTTSVAQQGPTTTVASAAVTTTTVPAKLPTTGSELSLAVLGGLLVAVGVTLLTVSRIRTV